MSAGQAVSTLLVLVIVILFAVIAMLQRRRFVSVMLVVLVGALASGMPGKPGEIVRGTAKFANEAPYKVAVFFI